MSEGHAQNPPPRGRLLAILLGGFAVAGAITVCVILPAEFHVDPTGIGTAAGLMSLSAAPEATTAAAPASAGAPSPPVLAREYPLAFRTDTIDIPLKGAEQDGSEVEYKVRMKPGQTLVYSWSVAAPADEFYYDFHSQMLPAPKETVISHKSGLGVGANGSLVAPFQGIHGWYFQNQSLKPVTVRLKLAGFYDLLPGGKPPE